MGSDRSAGDSGGQDPDADPEMKTEKAARQPDQAEGDDDSAETDPA
ncbi:hypothetical protein ACGFK1_19235 [Mycobacterium sp. NPDC048908]